MQYGIFSYSLLGDCQIEALTPDFEVLLETEQLSDLLERPSLCHINISLQLPLAKRVKGLREVQVVAQQGNMGKSLSLVESLAARSLEKGCNL